VKLAEVALDSGQALEKLRAMVMTNGDLQKLERFL
jgi:hypothetical protein